ncbi:MAG: nucleoside triphosphate pyrophosphohydrolase [Acidobacteria bacterium]|nr:nucleoside triphosphate pyrophosphohydrolase [Acidobacteriota bacterium]MYJ03668.1 nucleoside triphosphate pyrophosphohydrolase [Acidobacteriota bacterium]
MTGTPAEVPVPRKVICIVGRGCPAGDLLAYATVSTIPPDDERDNELRAAADGFAHLVSLMRTLRSEEGCAWDREQTLESLRPYVIEETYEVVDAIDRGDPAALRDELGDFLLEAVFLAQVAHEQGDFHISDSLQAICDKLIRRHPHVFPPAADGTTAGHGGVAAGTSLTSDDVKRQWDAIKLEERAEAGEEPGLLGTVPESLPALLRAYRLGKRAASAGFDWPDPSGVEEKVIEELAELANARTQGSHAAIEEELGDMLFAIANLARHLGVDPETALRSANRKFTERFTRVEARFRDRGIELSDASLDEMEAEWRRIKTGL